MNTSAIVVSIIHVLNLVAVITLIFFQRKESSTRFAWLMVLVFVPIIGFFLYMLFGHNYARREKIELSESASVKYHAFIAEQISNAHSMSFAAPRFVQLARMNLVNNNALVSNDNKVTVFNNGLDKFESLMRDIKSAKKYIHLLYFIFRTDELGKAILELLAQKAAEGLEVRVVYDDMGNIGVSSAGFNALRKAGGKVYRYSPVITGLVSANYRNHRKLAVIDGKIGYIGGMNIGTEYIEGRKKLTPWRDTHMRVQGSIVGMMLATFLADYMYAANQKEVVDNLARFLEPPDEEGGGSAVQILESSPQPGKHHIHAAYAKIISAAENYLYIQTPYLVPDRTIMDCLGMALASGVDVRIMLPLFPDKSFVYFATLDYARILCEQGAKIYLYRGFIHSKTMLADDEVVSIGSANMDVRSFFLSYEANALVFDREVAAGQREQFHQDMSHSVLADLEYFRRLPFPVKAMMPVCNLFSPLL